MSRRLCERLATLEHQRADLLAGLARLSHLQLEHRPNPSEWSIAAVIDHLAATEEAVVEMAERVRARGRGEMATIEAAAGSARVRGVRRRVRLWYRRLLVSAVLTAGVRVRMPRRVIEMVGTPDPRSAAAAVARWETARTRLARYVTTLGPGDERRPMFHHPLVGWLDHRRGLKFVQRHIRHHERQIGRIRKAGGF